MDLDLHSAGALETADGTTKRNVETLAAYAARTPAGKPRRIVLRFLSSPVAIEGDGRVEAVVVERNELVPDEARDPTSAADRTPGAPRSRDGAALDRLRRQRRYPASRSTATVRPCSTRTVV